MLPVVIIAAAVAAAQYYQAEKARGANQKRLRELENDFNSLVPPEFDLSPMDPPEYITASIPEPTYDFTSITPKQFEIVGRYAPEAAPYILEQKPELIQDSAASQEGLEAQLAALRKLRQAASDRGDPELLQELDEAAQRSQIEAQSRNQSILQDAERRGALDAGTTMAAQLQGSSDSMESAASASRDAAVAAHRNRLEALRASADLGGRVRGDELDKSARNASIINEFNARTTRAKQEWSNDRANMLNDAERRNLDESQRISDANISAENDASWRNRERDDELKTKSYGMKVDERNYQNTIKDRYATWKRDERDRADRLKQTAFGNELNIMGGKQGLGFAAMNIENQSAQDKNAAIQGVGNAVAGGYMANESNNQADENQMRADDRSFFEKNNRWMTEEEKRQKYGKL